MLMTTAATAAGAAALPASLAAADSDKDAGWIDAHSHIWPPTVDKYPLEPGQTVADLKPPSFTGDELMAIARPVGVRRVVLIQHNVYHGFDNSYLVDAWKAHADRYRVVGMVDSRKPGSGKAMRALHKTGVTGFRITPSRLGPNWLDTDGMAEMWIASHAPERETGAAVTLAIVLREPGQLIGAIGLRLVREFDKGELGYWVGKPFWNSGYATEAALAIVQFGFDELGLNRISATHFARNPASGRVMQKIGMQLEGTARQDVIKWGRYEDIVIYGMLRADFSPA